MKKLLKKIAIVIVGVIAVMSLINYLYMQTTVYNFTMLDLHRAKDQISETTEIINLGSSHGRENFDYTDFPVNGVNAGYDAQILHFDYQILVKYGQRLSENTYVVLPLSYVTFFNDVSMASQESIARYERIIDYYNPENGWLNNQSNYILNNYIPIINAPSLQCIWNDDKAADINKYYYSTVLEACELSESQLIEAGQVTYSKHTGDSTREYSEKAVEDLENIILFCKNNNLNLVFVTTPLSTYYLDCVDYKFVEEQFYSIVYEYSEQYDIPYFDYSHDERVINDINNFYDDDHLNAKGRKVFTEIVLKDLGLVN